MAFGSEMPAPRRNDNRRVKRIFSFVVSFILLNNG
jgi:hypothetical protein